MSSYHNNRHRKSARSRGAIFAGVTITAFALVVLAGSGAALARRKTKARPKAPTAQQQSDGVVNLNDASETQLRLLPGIGHTKAQRIIAYRTRRKFRQTYEVIRVRGIGRRSFRKLQRFLTVKGPTTMTHKPMRNK